MSKSSDLYIFVIVFDFEFEFGEMPAVIQLGGEDSWVHG